MKLSEYLVKYRLENNLTQSELAEKCNLSNITIFALEKQKRVGTRTLGKLANGLGKSYKTVFKQYMEDHDENNK